MSLEHSNSTVSAKYETCPFSLSVFLQRFEVWLEPNLCDKRRHDGTADHRRQKYGILDLIDDVVRETKQSRDRPECESRGHHQCGVHTLPLIKVKIAGQRQNPYKLSRHLHGQEKTDKTRPGHQCVRLNQRSGLE